MSLKDAVVESTRAWLYVRGDRSVRIVMDEAALAVYGPGDEFRRVECPDVMTAMVEHAALEEELVRGGWSLEQMTTERRSARSRPLPASRERRRGLRLVVDRPSA